VSVLTRLRESLGFERAEVAAAAGWPRGRLREIERDPASQVDEAEAVIQSDLYGMDVVEIIERDRLPSRRTAVAGLLKAKADVLDAESRFALAEAVTVAREARELQRPLVPDTGWKKLRSFYDNPDYSHPNRGTPATLAGQTSHEARGRRLLAATREAAGHGSTGWPAADRAALQRSRAPSAHHHRRAR